MGKNSSHQVGISCKEEETINLNANDIGSIKVGHGWLFYALIGGFAGAVLAIFAETFTHPWHCEYLNRRD